jgi:hypothetical protein
VQRRTRHDEGQRNVARATRKQKTTTRERGAQTGQAGNTDKLGELRATSGGTRARDERRGLKTTAGLGKNLGAADVDAEPEGTHGEDDRRAGQHTRLGGETTTDESGTGKRESSDWAPE